MKYRVVFFEGQEWETLEFTKHDQRSFVEAMGALMIRKVAAYLNPRTRPELQGQPVFESLCGPMYDGDGWIRYEDAKANEVLSR